jgi:general secretion pathway protein E
MMTIDVSGHAAALQETAPPGMPLPSPTVGPERLSLTAMQSLTPRFDALPFAQAARRRCALFRVNGENELPILVITGEDDTDLLAWARTRYGDFDLQLASDEAFDAWLAHAELAVSALASDGASAADAPAAPLAIAGEALSLQSIGADASPAIRFVNSTLYDALKTGASDVHLESDPGGMTVKFRLDGVLTVARRIDSPELALHAVNRIKVMAQLDIAECRVPQDGRLQIAYQARSIDVRVSIMPSIHGEDAVLRILDRQHLAQSLAGLTLAKLGFDEPMQVALRALCRKPHGMLLVTGPTGSGKTTTLYAAIAETHESRDKIITIEDPVEYQLPGVLQIPVNEKKGLTFARGLRSILRHDPDKILVGEIRDAETAQIAVQSSLTGHLVFTTVHANTVFDVVGRFEQFGIDYYTFASAINGVLAQRLLRRVCPRCAARGCDGCRGTGYSGRFALGELLTMTPDLKAMVARRAPHAEIQAEAAKSGWRGLAEQARAAVAAGLTRQEEVDRVAA